MKDQHPSPCRECSNAVLLLLCLTLFPPVASLAAQPPRFEWAKLLATTVYEERLMDLVVDEQGNAVMAHRQSARLNPYLNNRVVKLNANGETLWTHTGLPRISSLAIGPTGDVYVTGIARGNSEWPVRADYFQRAGIMTEGSGTAYIARLSRDGALQWVRLIGGPAETWMGRVTVDSQGNGFVVGGYRGTPTIGEPLPTAPLDRPEGRLFVAQFTAAGELGWVRASKQVENQFIDLVPNFSTIQLDGMEQPVVTFTLTSTGADFSDGQQERASHVVRFSGDGDFRDGLSVTLPESPDYRSLPGRRTLALDGSVYSTERLQHEGPGGSFAMLVLHRHRPNGELHWSREVPVQAENGVLGSMGIDNVDLQTDVAGNCYWLGSFWGRRQAVSLNFGHQTLVTWSESELFLAKYSSAGELLWVVQTEGLDPFMDYDRRFSGLRNNRLAVAPGGRVLLAGQLLGRVNFGELALVGRQFAEDLRYVASLQESGGVPVPDLVIERRHGAVSIWWQNALPDLVLESSTDVGKEAAWSPVVDGIVHEGDRSGFAVDSAAGSRFFRLRKPLLKP